MKGRSIGILAPHQFIPPKNGGHWGCFNFCEFLGRETDVVCICTEGNDHPEDASAIFDVGAHVEKAYVDAWPRDPAGVG